MTRSRIDISRSGEDHPPRAKRLWKHGGTVRSLHRSNKALFIITGEIVSMRTVPLWIALINCPDGNTRLWRRHRDGPHASSSKSDMSDMSGGAYVVHTPTMKPVPS